jgi:ubiquinone/menaquinone biosynthesis C-methylase UbiE
MGKVEQAKAKAAAAYNAAADNFDHPVSSFWHRYGRQTVDRLSLREGETVLDVCCGSGGSALSAAEASGRRAIAVDLAERLVQLGEAKARAKGLGNIEFRVEDMLALYPAASFDVVVCVFGIIFLASVQEAPAQPEETLVEITYVAVSVSTLHKKRGGGCDRPCGRWKAET